MACRFLSAALAAVLLFSGSVAARAETRELRIAIQDGLAYLPFIVMDKEKLVEKHAKAAGLPNRRSRGSGSQTA
jgi:NitT/TauT family transport system substrate-binding protein